MRKKLTPLQKIMSRHRYKYKYDFNKTTPGMFKALCPLHGPFNVEVFLHQKGKGCPKCEGVKFTFAQFVTVAKKKHSNLYEYPSQFFNPQKTVVIKCPHHGKFTKRVWDHLHGAGCPYCAKGMVTRENFIKDAIERHGDKYDYSSVPRGIIRGPIPIVCKSHGVFMQTHGAHISGSGCKDCSYKGGKWFYIYVILFRKGTRQFYKIGITDTPDRRYKELVKGAAKGYTAKRIGLYKLKEKHGVFKMENYILSNIPGKPVTKAVLSCGHTETKISKVSQKDMLRQVQLLIKRYQRTKPTQKSQVWRAKKPPAPSPLNRFRKKPLSKTPLTKKRR